MIKSIIEKLKQDSKYVQYFDTNKKLSYIMISTGAYKPYEKGRIIFLILADDKPVITVKFYKQTNGLIQNEFIKQEIIYKKCEGKGISKPLGVLNLNDLEILIEEAVNGQILERYISDNPSQNIVKSEINKVCSLYEHFNKILEPSTFDELCKEVNQLVEQFKNLYSIEEEEFETLRECVSIFLEHFKNKKVYKRFSNGDFISRNLITHDNNIVLIDFEYAHETHLYFFDWFRFFKYQYSLSNDYLYNIIQDMKLNDDLVISSLAEFTKYRTNKQFDIASRMIFEIKEYVQRFDSLFLALLNDEKKNMKKFILDVTLRLNEKVEITTQQFSSNDLLLSEKMFFRDLHSKIHEYAEFDNKMKNIQKKIVKQENKIKELESENKILKRTKKSLSTFVNHDKLLDTPSKKIVDELYLEILQRHADREGLMHFSLLLEKKKVTAEDLRKTLLDSNEYKILGQEIGNK